MTPLPWEKRFDEMFEIWKATDHGSKLENFPENHLNLALKVKRFISETLTSRDEELIAALEGAMTLCSHNSIPGYFDGADEGCSVCQRNVVLREAIALIKARTPNEHSL